ncbi:DNA replication/repair protein RecF [Neorickettsia sennetsu]|uniref:DNA replication and repair protein RecF n=1 Tax=Ehrlichia sennetsu (strain ATCC VR-367 / Miyayama) TaxID=222891 RepID=Q2GEK2_EHRS3|nr:DNA recombination protein RecF [Neorickettsia sennetsu]ABD45893.1 putative DNA replication and repair protein RecF [Neorickettsia sennetsu str. Miyayama]
MRPYITGVLVKDFRNHAFWTGSFKCRHVLLCGKNGAGKTSILEAISKLSPGLGLRSASNIEMVRSGSLSWEVSLKFAGSTDLREVGMGYYEDKRVTKLNGKSIQCFKKVIDLVKVMWLTPQMSNLFTTDKSVRRKFFDRMVALSEPQHLENLVMYERFKSERLKILNAGASKMWLDVNEKKLAELCIAITDARVSFIGQLMSNFPSKGFGSPEIKLFCPVASAIGRVGSSQQMQCIQSALERSRAIDTVTGKMQFGVHRTDFLATVRQGDNTARCYSTGEQKLLILGIILAAGELIDIILLDDIFAHLDLHNSSAFLLEATKKNCQFFFSDLDNSKFAQFANVIHTIPV